jgi:hypothetical protein
MGDVFEAPLKNSLASLKQATPGPGQGQSRPLFCRTGRLPEGDRQRSGRGVALFAAGDSGRSISRRPWRRANTSSARNRWRPTPPGSARCWLPWKRRSGRNWPWWPGFCWRYDLPRREFFKRVHDGAIGECAPFTALTTPGRSSRCPRPANGPAGMTDLEWQLHNWYNFTWICGDSLVEQAVHSVDKMAWAMKDECPSRRWRWVAARSRRTAAISSTISRSTTNTKAARAVSWPAASRPGVTARTTTT